MHEILMMMTMFIYGYDDGDTILLIFIQKIYTRL